MADILKENKSGLVLTRNDNVLKTAVILSFAAITMTGIIGYYIASCTKKTAQINANKEVEIAKIEMEKTKYNAKYNDIFSETDTIDKLTSCIQIIMRESRESGKSILAKEAKEVCKDHREPK